MKNVKLHQEGEGGWGGDTFYPHLPCATFMQSHPGKRRPGACHTRPGTIYIQRFLFFSLFFHPLSYNIYIYTYMYVLGEIFEIEIKLTPRVVVPVCGGGSDEGTLNELTTTGRWEKTGDFVTLLLVLFYSYLAACKRIKIIILHSFKI